MSAHLSLYIDVDDVTLADVTRRLRDRQYWLLFAGIIAILRTDSLSVRT